MINGEFKTVAAAERAAGIGKPKMTAVEKVVKAFDRLSDEEKLEFKKQVIDVDDSVKDEVEVIITTFGTEYALSLADEILNTTVAKH